MYQTTSRLNLRNFRQKLLINHFKTACASKEKKDTKIEEILLLEFLDATLCRKTCGVTLMHETSRRSAIYLIIT